MVKDVSLQEERYVIYIFLPLQAGWSGLATNGIIVTATIHLCNFQNLLGDHHLSSAMLMDHTFTH